MTEGAVRSAGARRGRFAFAAVFCALAVGPGCERESFDLLNVAGNAALAGSAGSAQAGAGMSGAPNGLAGGGSGNEPDGGAGRMDTNHGGFGAGFGAGAGFGQGGFGAGGLGCIPGQPCMNGGWFCPPTVSLCVRCDSMKDCHAYSDLLPYCSAVIGRCVQCRPNENDCGIDKVCDPYMQRCAHRCQSSTECADDFGHPICNPQLGACVVCTSDLDCPAEGARKTYCADGSCVECNQSNADAATPAEVQCPIEKPYCVGLRCQGSKPH